MFRKLVVMLAVLLLIPICTRAFTAADLARLGERELVKIGARQFVQAEKVQSCGPYFFLAKPCRSDNSIIVVRIKISFGDPPDMLPYFFFRPDQIRIDTKNDLPIPRARIQFRDLEPESVTIRISETQLRESPCLLPPVRP